MTTRLDLFTDRFQTFAADTGVPVRVSNGAPRWKLAYTLPYAVKEVMPAWALVKAKKPHDEFAALYRAALDDVGVDAIESRLRAIATAAGDNRLVLLCFEDLSTGSTCHRTVFGAWWEERTGRVVTELGKTRPDVGVTLTGTIPASLNRSTAPADPTPRHAEEPLF